MKISVAATTAVTATVVLIAAQVPSVAQTDSTIKSGPEINEISQRTTLLIAGTSGDSSSHGSGSLVARDGETCVGVTNAHVVAFSGSQDFTFFVRTFDGVVHPVDDIQPFQEDLALVTFECEQAYEPISIATYQLSPGQDVYLSGWPGDSTPTGDLVRQFTSGSISTILDSPVEGYQVGYTNVTNSGMSGGQVLDAAGRLVAIHGLGAREDAGVIASRLNVSESTAAQLADKTGFNYGIPATTFLARASQTGSYPFDVAYSLPQAPESGAPVASGDYEYQPDSSDRVSFSSVMDNVGQLLDNVNRGAGIVCRFFRC